jgi:hypothetical protein
MEKSTTDEQEELDDLNEIVSFTEDVLERMDAKSIAGHLTLVKRVGVILITFTSILCFAETMQIVLSSVTQTNTTMYKTFLSLFHRAEVCADRVGVPNNLQHEERECHRNAEILQRTTNVRRIIFFIICSVDFLEKTCTFCRQSLAHC